MFFSFATRSTVLFQGWTTATFAGTALGVVSGALLSLGLECLKIFNATRMVGRCCKPACKRFSVPKRLFSSVTHSMDMLASYLLMLIVMTFNIYIFIAVIVGAGIGHFLFRPVFFRYMNARNECGQSGPNTANIPMEDVVQECTCSSVVEECTEGGIVWQTGQC